MRVFRSVLFACCGLLALASTTACSDPNDPTSPGTAPAVRDIQPATPSASPAQQSIVISGENFSNESFVILREPGGARTTYTGQDISARSARSLTVTVVLQTAGSWGLVVRNADTAESTEFLFSVVSTTGNAAPQAVSVSPSIITASSSSQFVTVTGSDFRPGVSLLVTDPNGNTNIISSGLISNQTDTSLSASIVFNVVGTYTLTVHNMDGTQSSPLSVLVNKPPAA